MRKNRMMRTSYYTRRSNKASKSSSSDHTKDSSPASFIPTSSPAHNAILDFSSLFSYPNLTYGLTRWAHISSSCSSPNLSVNCGRYSLTYLPLTLTEWEWALLTISWVDQTMLKNSYLSIWRSKQLGTRSSMAIRIFCSYSSSLVDSGKLYISLLMLGTSHSVLSAPWISNNNYKSIWFLSQ